MSFDEMAKIVHQLAQRQKDGTNELVKHEALQVYPPTTP